MFPSLALRLSVCLSLSLWHSLSVSLALFLSMSLSFSVGCFPLCLYLSLALSLTRSLRLSSSLSFSVMFPTLISLHLCVSHSFSLSLTPSLPVYRSITSSTWTWSRSSWTNLSPPTAGPSWTAAVLHAPAPCGSSLGLFWEVLFVVSRPLVSRQPCHHRWHYSRKTKSPFFS